MQLSDVAVRQSKPAETPYKLFDGNGLFLLVKPNGSRLWRFKDRFQGRENLMALGAYPIISLKEARGLSDEARRILARGDDPNREKKRAQVAASLAAKATFSAVAEEYLEKRSREGASLATVKKSRWLVSLLEKDVGAIPIAQMEAYELLGALRKVEATGRLESAARALSLAGQIFRYAIATTRARHNIAADLRGALAAPRPEHYAALLEPKAVGALIRAIDAFEGQAATSFALRLAPHVFVRPGELRKAEWSEIDLEIKVWRIPAPRMKMRREHAVPLSSQAVAILQEARRLTGSGRFVFPGVRTADRPISDNTLNAALRRLGYSAEEMTTHGFRSTASTLLNESGKWSADAIERALAHGDGNRVRAAYHRGQHWAERVEMAQWWSDYLDQLRACK
jgi:integrase